MPVILLLSRQRQKSLKFKATLSYRASSRPLKLSYIVRPFLKPLHPQKSKKQKLNLIL
jgi:hypothetical protein